MNKKCETEIWQKLRYTVDRIFDVNLIKPTFRRPFLLKLYLLHHSCLNCIAIAILSFQNLRTLKKNLLLDFDNAFRNIQPERRKFIYYKEKRATEDKTVVCGARMCIATVQRRLLFGVKIAFSSIIRF